MPPRIIALCPKCHWLAPIAAGPGQVFPCDRCGVRLRLGKRLPASRLKAEWQATLALVRKIECLIDPADWSSVFFRLLPLMAAVLDAKGRVERVKVTRAWAAAGRN